MMERILDRVVDRIFQDNFSHAGLVCANGNPVAVLSASKIFLALLNM